MKTEDEDNLDGLNSRQALFVEAYLSGMPAGRAYEKAGYKVRGNTADVQASQLLRNPKVARAVAAGKKENRELAKMTREQAVDWLVETLLTPVADIDETHRLAQEVTTEEVSSGAPRGELKRGQSPSGNEASGPMILRKKVKMVGKIEAMKQLAAMCGWNAPEELKHTADDTLLAFLKGLRSRK